jgi:hypothetical protein
MGSMVYVSHYNSNPPLNFRLNGIKDEPDIVLDRVATFIEQNPGESLNVRFYDDEENLMAGVDRGGLRAQLITDLFEGIHKSNIIHFETLQNGRLLPISNGLKLSKAEGAKWEQVGTVFKYCLEREKQIGAIFEDSFFEALYAFDVNVIDYYKDFATLLGVYKLLKKNDEDETRMISQFERLVGLQNWTDDDQVEAFFLIYPEQTEVRKIRDVRNKLQRAMVSVFTPKMKRYLEPLRCIAKVCNQGRFLSGFKPEEICVNLQGTIDKEHVLGFTDFLNDSNKANFERWVKESTDSELKALIKATTGSSAMGGETITVRGTASSMVNFHTCSRTIDIPHFDTYKLFKKMLDLSIEYALAGGFLQI